MSTTYYLKNGHGEPWREVTVDEYAQAERAVGVEPAVLKGTMASGSFTGPNGVAGKVRYDLKGMFNAKFKAKEIEK